MDMWNIRISGEQLQGPITLTVPKDCYSTKLYEEVIRLTNIDQANIRLSFQGSQLSNNPREMKRLSDYRITNNAQLSAHVNRPAPPAAAETWIINIRQSAERNDTVRVPKDCLIPKLFEEVNKKVPGAANVRLMFQDREVLNDAHKRLSDYGITNNAHLTVLCRVTGG